MLFNAAGFFCHSLYIPYIRYCKSLIKNIIMKRILLQASLIAICSFAFITCKNAANTDFEANVQEFYDSFEIKRGTNIAHWLSQSDRRGAERERFFTKDDVDYIAQLGFDHVRIPIDEEQMWDEEGKRHQEAFQLLENALRWCHDNDLRAIVDLHILRSHHFNAEEKPLWTEPEAQDRFIDLWRDLSSALNKWPVGMVAYELMNEPVADDPELWNNLVAKAANAIRELEPERIVVIGSNRWQSADTFDELKLPANDTNILLSYHFYEPFLLTHYKASWTFLDNYQGPVHYPDEIITRTEWEDLNDDYKERLTGSTGKTYNKKVLTKMMQKPRHKSEHTGLNLYCGEFGVIDGAPREDALAWYRDMIAIFEEYDIAYANWNYKSGSFGLVDGDMNPDQELIDIILGN